MNHIYRLASTLVIAASAAILTLAPPTVAQTSPTIGGPMPGAEAPASTGAVATANDAMTSAAQGNETNSDNLLTGHEAIMGPVIGQGTTYGGAGAAASSLGIPSVANSLMAPNSVNMAPFPSGQFLYGFPNEGTTSLTGVSQKIGNGGFMSPVGTSSVNINTVDCPFIRLPNEGNGVNGGNGLGNINIALPLPGGTTINTSINPVQTINQLNNFFSGL
jgi:hypothetical protein